MKNNNKSKNKNRNIKIELEYDGTNYNGFQKQPNQKTIQGEIEKAIEKVFGENISINGAGRTDAGVHALGQVCNFNISSDIKAENITMALNTILPGDIVIKTAEDVNEKFHARKSAKQKQYKYVINNNKVRSAINRKREVWYKYNIDIDIMKEASKLLIGKHDYRAFMSSGSSIKDTVRTIKEIEIEKCGGIITINITGDGFLYNMVRIIAGTLIEIASAKRKIEDISKAFETKERTFSGKTMPPQGLYLVKIWY